MLTQRTIIRLMVYLTFFFVPGASMAATLYDTFSTNYVKKALWLNHRNVPKEGHEFVREIDSANHVLVLKMGTNKHPQPMRNHLQFQETTPIQAIKADVKVVAMNIDQSDQPDKAPVFTRIGSYFYNKDTDNPTSADGDIWVAICLGDRGNGLEAFYVIREETINDRNQSILLTSPTLDTGSLQLEHFYTLELEYDGSSNFTFRVYDGASLLAEETYAPAFTRLADPWTQFKGLSACVNTPSSRFEDGYIHAEFDNVYLNGSAEVYDAFDGTMIDIAKWHNLELVREIVNGKARLHTRNENEDKKNRLLLRDAYARYLESTVRVDSGSWINEGGEGRAKIAGYFYNESHEPGSYNDTEGDAWADLALCLRGMPGGSVSLVANAKIEIWAAGDVFDRRVLWQDFSMPLAFDRDYTLSIDVSATGINFTLPRRPDHAGGDTFLSIHRPSLSCL